MLFFFFFLFSSNSLVYPFTLVSRINLFSRMNPLLDYLDCPGVGSREFVILGPPFLMWLPSIWAWLTPNEEWWDVWGSWCPVSAVSQPAGTSLWQNLSSKEKPCCGSRMCLNQGWELGMSWPKAHGLPALTTGVETPGNPALAVMVVWGLAASFICHSDKASGNLANSNNNQCALLYHTEWMSWQLINKRMPYWRVSL